MLSFLSRLDSFTLTDNWIIKSRLRMSVQSLPLYLRKAEICEANSFQLFFLQRNIPKDNGNNKKLAARRFLLPK